MNAFEKASRQMDMKLPQIENLVLSLLLIGGAEYQQAMEEVRKIRKEGIKLDRR